MDSFWSTRAHWLMCPLRGSIKIIVSSVEVHPNACRLTASGIIGGIYSGACLYCGRFVLPIPWGTKYPVYPNTLGNQGINVWLCSVTDVLASHSAVDLISHLRAVDLLHPLTSQYSRVCGLFLVNACPLVDVSS